MKIMDKLSTYAALLGVIGAIGGGFYTWGQFNSRLDAIESTPAVNLTPLKDKDKELNLKVDSALLYAISSLTLPICENTEVKSTGCIFSSTCAILSIKSTLYSLA